MISVIIPAYNAARFLTHAIDSVLAQGAGPLDILVVDDGSTDDTMAIAESFGAPVRCLSQSRGGVAAARNKGIEQTTGDLIAFLDADDLWTHGRLAHQLAALSAEPLLEAVFGQVQQFSADAVTGERIMGPRQEGHTPSAMLIRRDAIERVGRYNGDLPLAESLDWYLRAQAAGLNHVVLSEVVLLRRVHGQNASIVNRETQMRQYFQVLRARLRQKTDRAD